MNIEVPKGSLISYMSTKVKNGGGINLAQGLPGFNPPERLTQHLAQVSLESFHQYPPGTGNFRLTELIRGQLYHHYPLDPSELLITQGATEALSLLFLYLRQKLKDNFTVLSFSPPYESYRQLPLHFGHPFVELDPLGENNLPLGEIEQQIEQNNVRLIFLASPGNPRGVIFRQEDIVELISLCEQKSCYLLFDAVYRSLYFENEPYFPLEKLNPYLFITDSFSKLWSVTGWRIGYLISHASHSVDLRSMHDYTGLCANAPAQEAIVRFAEETDFGKEYSSTLRSAFHRNYLFAFDKLKAFGFNPLSCQGGYFIWSKLPESHKNGFAFAENLYDEKKVAIVPGLHFSPAAHDFVRINIARPENELTEGLKRIGEFLFPGK